MFFIYVFISYEREARSILSSKNGPQDIEKNAPSLMGGLHPKQMFEQRK